jgi:hypothetical protein
MSSTSKTRKPNDPQKPQPGENRKKIYFAFFLFAFVTFLYWEELMTRSAGTCISANQSEQGPLAADLTGDPVAEPKILGLSLISKV